MKEEEERGERERVAGMRDVSEKPEITSQTERHVNPSERDFEPRSTGQSNHRKATQETTPPKIRGAAAQGFGCARSSRVLEWRPRRWKWRWSRIPSWTPFRKEWEGWNQRGSGKWKGRDPRRHENLAFCPSGHVWSRCCLAEGEPPRSEEHFHTNIESQLTENGTV